MKKLLIVAVIIVLTGANSQSQPRLVVLSPTFDFGSLPQNTTLVHRFWFKSAGTDTLRITEIKTGCACAVMPLEKDWIAPGDSMEVGIHWETGKSLGPINRFPRVFTNAGPDPLKLHLKGMVVSYPDSLRPISVKPYRFELAKSSRKDIDSLSFVLINHSTQDLAISLISTPPEEVEVVFPDSVRALSNSSGYVRLKPGFADLEFQTSLTLLVSDQRNTHITIPVRRKFYIVKEK